MILYKIALSSFVISLSIIASAQKVDYSVISVDEEAGLLLKKITNDNDQVCMPEVKRNIRGGISWFTNRIIDISSDGGKIAFLASRSGSRNIFIKDLSSPGVSVQRTRRSAVNDFSYSPDGKSFCFSETIGGKSSIFLTDANQGMTCRQITDGSMDYTPIFNNSMSQIFFARQEANGVGLWSYDVGERFLSNYTRGQNPYPAQSSIIYFTRVTDGRGEIWKVDIETGIEECIVSHLDHSFTTPELSPNGEWLLFTGSSKINYGNRGFWNTDIYVCRINGEDLTQLTYHAADDLSPVWSDSGNEIFFVSQRGSENAIPNVWKMIFVVD